jgi:hypothetical protein
VLNQWLCTNQCNLPVVVVVVMLLLVVVVVVVY